LESADRVYLGAPVAGRVVETEQELGVIRIPAVEVLGLREIGVATRFS